MLKLILEVLNYKSQVEVWYPDIITLGFSIYCVHWILRVLKKGV